MWIIAPLLCGLIFGAGLLISGMVQPTKVLGFLDIFGAWDPSLAVVMAAALAVSVPGSGWLIAVRSPGLPRNIFGRAKRESTCRWSRAPRCSESGGALWACARDRRWRVSRRCRPGSSSLSPRWPLAWWRTTPGNDRG